MFAVPKAESGSLLFSHRGAERVEQVRAGDTVKVHYVGKLDDGSIFDASSDREPLELTIGDGRIIPGFEQAVMGMDLRESKTVRIPCDEAYGPYREEMVMVVGKHQLPPDLTPEVGQHLRIPRNDGQEGQVIVAVTKISDADVTLDANHPLAGKDLTFEIQLVEIV